MKRPIFLGVLALVLLVAAVIHGVHGRRPPTVAGLGTRVSTPIPAPTYAEPSMRDGDFEGKIAAAMPSAPHANPGRAGADAGKAVMAVSGSNVPELVSQKIIYSGSVDLTTKDFDKAEWSLL